MYQIYFMTFVIKDIDTIKGKFSTSHLFPTQFDIYEEVIQKDFVVTSCALSLIMISMLSLFECISRSSSLG